MVEQSCLEANFAKPGNALTEHHYRSRNFKFCKVFISKFFDQLEKKTTTDVTFRELRVCNLELLKVESQLRISNLLNISKSKFSEN